MEMRLLWAMRALWVALPLVGGPAIGRALPSSDVGTTALVIAWIGFAIGLACMAVPRTATLTVLRVVVPASLPLCAFVLARTAVDAATVTSVGTAAAVTALALSAQIGTVFADGSSYGPERRMFLRPPTVVAVLLVPVAWAVVIVGFVAGPLLVADRRWIIGAATVVVGFAAALFMLRALNRLTLRWLVFVPNGVVMVDHTTLCEPVAIPGRTIRTIGPLPLADSDRLADLTAGASGLVLRIETIDPLVLARRSTGPAPTVTESAAGVLFVPSRPGALLAEADLRRLPVG